MRLATYVVQDSAGPFEVSISRFPGRVGGELANLNRWRGQMGLEAIDEARLDEALTRFAADGFKGYEARIESSSGVMLAAGVFEAAADQTWFVRATVPTPDAAERHAAEIFGVARSIAEGTSGG